MSRICQEIEQQVQAFLSRPLQESGYAYVYLGPPEKAATAAGQQRWLIASL
jgi:hypothetical protein